MKSLPSAEYVRSILDYNKQTGLFTWKVNRPPRGIAGEIAGHDNGSGYVKISIGGVRYYAHRLAFLHTTGEWPKDVDHINGCRWDNRWSNLRDVETKTNCANVPGRKGIRYRHGKWYARYATKHLGAFDSKDDAVAARRNAEIFAAGLDPNEPRTTSTVPRMRKKHRYGYVFLGKSLSELAKETGIPKATLYWRIVTNGEQPESAILRGTKR